MKIEEKVPNALLWKVYDTVAPIDPFDIKARVDATAKLVLELMEHSYKVGRAEAGTMKTFKDYISDYE